MDSQDEIDMREALSEMQQLYGSDSPEFLEFVQSLSTGDDVFEKKYDPVPIKQFIEDPYFMGGTLDEIWPNVITSVTEVIEGRYEEAIFDGCISRAKTTRATIVNAYQLYVLSCYVSPQKALGLMSNSDLYMVMLNKTMLNAQRVTYAKFRKLIEGIPYFRENFKHDPNIESEMRFPNGIFVIASNADNDKLMGLDVIGGCFPPEQKFISSTGQLEVMGDNIGVEQSVLTTDVNDQVIKSNKTKVINTGKKPLVKMIFDNGETIVCTPDQKFKDENNNWVRANDGKGRKFRFNKLSDLQEVGNLLSGSFKQEISLARCIEVQSFSTEPTLVYDVENSGSTHVFFAPTSGGKVAIQAKNCIDEINFYAVTEKSKKTHDKGTYNQALTIYNGLKARITSRFEGIDIGIKGCMCVVSSRAYKDDFTGNKIKEIKQREKEGLPQTTYLSTGSFWSFAPQYRKDGSERYSSETFLLAIGSDRLKSEIINDMSEANGREVIDVPENYRQQFKEDIERGIRDFAGTVSGVTGSYFTNPEVIWAATDLFVNKFQRIFVQEEWDLSLGFPDLNPNYRLYHRLTPRFIHLDLSLTGDNTGIGIAHSITDEKVRTSRLQPSTDFEKAPIIIYDDFLAIKPPEVGEISYAAIRKLIYYLMDVVGLKIKWVSADTYNSNDMLQILSDKRGIETTKLSVEKEEPYLALKNAYNEERVILAPHEMAINELLTVVKDDKGNIDHLARNSKDVADTMVGCYTNMMKVHEQGELYTRHKQMMRSVYSNLGSRRIGRIPE